MIPYLNADDSINAARWNTLFAASNAWMLNALGGASAVLMGMDQRWDRYFFFFDPLASMAGLHPVAQIYLNNQQPSLFRRQYSDAAIFGLIGTPSSTSAAFGVALLPLPTFSTWATAIFPDHPTTFTTVPVTWLDASLKVIKVTVSSVQYNATYQDVEWAERVQPFKPIDIFVTSNFTWDSNWDKYSICRVHNCSLNAITAFGQSIGGGCSKCFRVVSGSWTYCMEYFHTMQPNDPRFFQMREASTYNGVYNLAWSPGYTGGVHVSMPSGATFFVPGIALDMLATVRDLSDLNTGRKRFDYTKLWDATAIYNNASHTPAGPYEKTPPTGGYFPTPGSGTPIGDLIVPRGKFLVIGADVLVPAAGNWVDFDGFASLATKLAAAGLFTRALVESETTFSYPATNTLNNVEIYSTNNRHLVDTSCPLVTFITGGTTACKLVGADQAHGSLKLPWLMFLATAVTSVVAGSGTSLQYRQLVIDGSGNPATGDIVTVVQTNRTGSYAGKQFPFLPTNTIGDLQNWIQTTTQAGGIVRVENFVFQTTAFGMAMLWDEIYPVDEALNVVQMGAYYYFNTDSVAKITANLSTVEFKVTRMVLFEHTRYRPAFGSPDSHKVWPSVLSVEGNRHQGQPNQSSSLLAWHYPRTDRAYINYRYFLHDPADAPMMPASFVGPGAYYGNYSMRKVQGSGLPTQDELTDNEWNFIRSFYETRPISVDTLLPLVPIPKIGISRCGAWTNQSDWWAVFSNWMNAAGDIICVVGGGTMTLGCGSGAYGGYSAQFLAGGDMDANYLGPHSSAPKLPSVNPCQIEHYNSLASLVNAFPPIRFDALRSSSIVFGSPTYLPTDFFPTFAPGSIDSTGMTPRNAFFLWGYTIGSDFYGDWFRARGITVQSTLPDGYISTGLYEWITIDDARALYASLNMPFVLRAAAIPFRWQSWTVPNGSGTYTQGDFFCDPAGAWVSYFGAEGVNTALSICSATSPLAEKTRHWGGPVGTAPAEFAPAGILHNYPFPWSGDVAVEFPEKWKWDYTAVVFYREGNICDLAVVMLPENAAYYDRPWCTGHVLALASLGVQVVPIIADNTIEESAAEIFIVSGRGGDSGTQYQYTLTTSLLNARMAVIEVDDVIYPPDPVNPLGM